MSTRTSTYRLEVAPFVSLTLTFSEVGEYEGTGFLVEDSRVEGATLEAYGHTVDLLADKDGYTDPCTHLERKGIDAYDVVTKGKDVTDRAERWAA